MIERLTPRTVLEAFLPPDGAVPLALVYDTANLAGLADQPLRLTIRRMIAAGEITQSGRGRSGNITLTDHGRQRLHRDRLGLALAFAQDVGRVPWDGSWRLLALSAPERERAVRDALRRELLAAGAALISTGLYLSAHDLRDMLGADVRAKLVTASATDLDVRGTSDPRVLTEILWPPTPVVDAYDVVERALVADAAEPESPVLVRQLHLADALERAMRHDPLIPLELRRGPWRPSATRAAWARRWRTLRDRAGGDCLYSGW